MQIPFQSQKNMSEQRNTFRASIERFIEKAKKSFSEIKSLGSSKSDVTNLNAVNERKTNSKSTCIACTCDWGPFNCRGSLCRTCVFDSVPSANGILQKPW